MNLIRSGEQIRRELDAAAKGHHFDVPYATDATALGGNLPTIACHQPGWSTNSRYRRVRPACAAPDRAPSGR